MDTVTFMKADKPLMYIISKEVTGLLHHQRKSMPYRDGKLLSHDVVLATNYKWLSLTVSHPVVLVSG